MNIIKLAKRKYWALRKKLGWWLMFRVIFPKTYAKAVAEHKKVKVRKAVFIEMRFAEITDSFRLVYDRMIAEGYEVKAHYLQNTLPGKKAFIERCQNMLTDMADARFVFVNDSCNVTSCIKLRKETDIYQLWHACGAFKKFGMSTAELKFGENRKTLLKYPNYGNLRYVTVSSPEVVWAYEEAMNLKPKDHQVIPIGISRTDIFYDKDFLESARQKVYSVFPQAEGKKIILYAPTYRGRVAKAESPDELDLERMKQALGDQYVFLAKHHPFVKEPPVIPASCRDFAMDVTKHLQIEELLAVSDICISDYSSVIFEYSLFERPMIFFAYDIADYNDWRGFYYDFEELTPGPIFTKTEEVIDHIAHIDERFDREEMRAFRDKYMSACDGHATDRIMELVHGKSYQEIS